MKKMVVFDLDGTLAESKTAVDSEMAELLGKLLAIKTVAVTGGGSWHQFKKQLLVSLKPQATLSNLYLLPTNGAIFYRFERDKWLRKYQILLSVKERQEIREAFAKVFEEIDYVRPIRTYGAVLDDRGSQVTFSALGQRAPLEERQKWHKTADRRREIRAKLKKCIPQFEILLTGVTSIDVIKPGIDKYFAVKQMMKLLRLKKNEIIFVGDAMSKGGNDYVVKKTGVEIKKVVGPNETKKIIRSLLSNIAS